ncbi:MAG: SDR family NAD(P)-dependent oxidoreductase, partial [Polyangiaceae bacterium]|nr:SDR family NAD(P)-dependent oxidoreductase [Polyangiaceae bacterium]
LTQLVLPSMRRRGAGKIVNVSSMAGKIYAPLGSWYHATKHALEGWSDCLRLELAPFGIDVVIVEPGVIQTEFGEVMRKPMMDRSGGTAYANLAQRLERWTVRAYRGNRASPPSVIADVIARAIRARRPRPRYAAGRFAKTTMFLRKWLGDRLFDWILRRAS